MDAEIKGINTNKRKKIFQRLQRNVERKRRKIACFISNEDEERKKCRKAKGDKNQNTHT